MVRLVNIAILLLSVCLVWGCSEGKESLSREELMLIGKSKDLIEQKGSLRKIENYVAHNRTDPMGYKVKAIFLIKTKSDFWKIHNALNSLSKYDSQENKRGNDFLFGMLLLQNGYCREALNGFNKIGFDLYDKTSLSYKMISLGYVDCLRLKNDSDGENLGELYDKIYQNTGFDHEVAISYLYYLSKYNAVTKMKEVISRYNQSHPTASDLDEIMCKYNNVCK
jgi:hypothetical protein